jgi:hypothetical protein
MWNTNITSGNPWQTGFSGVDRGLNRSVIPGNQFESPWTVSDFPGFNVNSQAGTNFGQTQYDGGFPSFEGSSYSNPIAGAGYAPVDFGNTVRPTGLQRDRDFGSTDFGNQQQLGSGDGNIMQQVLHAFVSLILMSVLNDGGNKPADSPGKPGPVETNNSPVVTRPSPVVTQPDTTLPAAPATTTTTNPDPAAPKDVADVSQQLLKALNTLISFFGLGDSETSPAATTTPVSNNTTTGGTTTPADTTVPTTTTTPATTVPATTTTAGTTTTPGTTVPATTTTPETTVPVTTTTTPATTTPVTEDPNLKFITTTHTDPGGGTVTITQGDTSDAYTNSVINSQITDLKNELVADGTFTAEEAAELFS